MEKTERPYIIAGPCSVESREQLQQVTETLARLPQVRMIRAGVWKPRTRPGGFEGLGEPALRWMQEFAAEYHTHYCCEVARPEHVALCQQYGIQTVWIGARTTANPFMVEELCEALRGSDMGVMVKNPVSPDVRLWIGAVERLQKAGIERVSAIHRGFDVYNNLGYRNAPLWEVVMEFRRERPDIHILCDPSHIGGRADLVTKLSLAATQLDYDGLMIEVHPHPADAWTDSSQQINPESFRLLLADIMEAARATHGDGSSALEPLRKQIDDIDHEMLHLLAQRMDLSRRIATVKREAQLTVYQAKRWSDVMDDRLALAEQLGINPDFIKGILESIHGESVRVQMEK